MGRKIVLVGDLGTDHDGFPPTPVTAGSPTVTIDGKPVARLGDPLAPHDKPNHGPHPRTIAEGSGSILIDGKPAALTGHTVSCGGVVIGGASAVGGESNAGALSSPVSSPDSTAAQASASSTAETVETQPIVLGMSEAGKRWLMDVEQLRLMPYDDQTGREITSWVAGATIGYGHLIPVSKWSLYRKGIVKEQAELLLEEDLERYVQTVNSEITTPLTQPQFDAAVILAYNIGIYGFTTSSAVKLINDPYATTPYSTLEAAWKAWNKSQGIINQGLINRRGAEWDMYDKGVYRTW